MLKAKVTHFTFSVHSKWLLDSAVIILCIVTGVCFFGEISMQFFYIVWHIQIPFLHILFTFLFSFYLYRELHVWIHGPDPWKLWGKRRRIFTWWSLTALDDDSSWAWHTVFWTRFQRNFVSHKSGWWHTGKNLYKYI